MNTPHHQINIHPTPNDRHNPVGRLSDNQHNHGDRLPGDSHNLSGHQPNDRYDLDGRHNSNYHLPDYSHNPGGNIDGRQVTRNHNAQYNKHHVKESLTTRVTKLLCAVFLCILFAVGLTMFILWLSVHPRRPRFHIQEFSILGLGAPNGLSTARITFNVTARNPNLDVGIYYDKMNLTVYYQDQTIAESPLLYPFYQSPEKTAIVYGTLSGPTLRIDRASWMQILAARKKGAVPIKVDVASSIRYKVSAWGSKHHNMHANCEIDVGSNGVILANDKKKKCPVYFT